MINVNGTTIEFKRFPNGETKVETDLNKLHGVFVNSVHFKYESDSDFIKLMFVANHLKEKAFNTFSSLYIQYMPYSRMDRSESSSVFTLKFVANLINSMNFHKVVVVEPHSDVTCALLNNSEARYINYDLLDDVVQMTNFKIKNDYLVFPDSGAQKRYSKILGYNTLVGNKVRNFETGRIESLDIIGKYNGVGKKAIIVDDLSSYGGTFVGTAKELRKLGFEEVYLLVAHAENSVFEGELFDHIDELFTTDSIISKQNYWNNARFKDKLHVFKLEEIL